MRLYSCILLLLLSLVSCQKEKTEIRSYDHVFVIGWDGADYKAFSPASWPNSQGPLSRYKKEGEFRKLHASIGKTETKPGWSQIFTGETAEVTGVLSNRAFAPIPKGITIFEELKDKGWQVHFLGGKVDNIGTRGPHKICLNCLKRDPKTYLRTSFRQEDTKAPLKLGEKRRLFVKRKGEPFFHAKKSFDSYEAFYDNADLIHQKSLDLVKKIKPGSKTFHFLHFGEPDETTHREGGLSNKYLQQLYTLESRLEELEKQLKTKGLYDQSVILALSDHGADRGQKNHKNAPDCIFFSNRNVLGPLNLKTRLNGVSSGSLDRLDVYPILRSLSGLRPKILPETFVLQWGGADGVLVNQL